MRFLSVCSGIEAASCAWTPLGWEAAALSEIDPFACAVLRHRYPDVPLHGDFTTIGGDEYGAVDLVVGGTPCQAFSVAGLRGGLDDARGNLALGFAQLVGRVRPRWLVWENVPGVLSSGEGKDFASLLGALVELGYGFAWRVLDAVHWGVPQRRRRVFLVGHLGDWRYPAAVLFERQCLSGNPAPRRPAPGKDASLSGAGTPGEGEFITFHPTQDPISSADGISHAMTAGNERGRCTIAIAQCLMTGTGRRYDAETETLIPEGHLVRRLTPIECERLMGFPDNWTRIPWRGKAEEDCPDGPRYRAIGNSIAVPVLAWIGQRIENLYETLSDAVVHGGSSQ